MKSQRELIKAEISHGHSHTVYLPIIIGIILQDKSQISCTAAFCMIGHATWYLLSYIHMMEVIM